MASTHRNLVYLALATAALTIVGCTDEVLVYRDQFNPPADQSSGFLGYFTVADKQTTCGNCHSTTHARWRETAHAGAWETLQESGHAQAFCEGCHSVSELGNSVTAAAGYNAVADASYHDVQCESCHGPGLDHVQNPELTQPLASIRVASDLTNGCGECHQGSHQPFVEQWEQSAHGSGSALARAGANPSCAPCHEGRTALEVKFGVSRNYVEKSLGESERITCAVCHDPHGSDHEKQLRRSISEPSLDNLCITCHSRKGTPPWSTASATSPARGAHAAQGLLVIGQNVGWFPPDFPYDTARMTGSHGTAGNTRLCASCHVARTTVTDQLTGEFQFQSVGHLFNAIPCLDSEGLPTVEGDCTLGERDFTGCATGGCHTTVDGAVAAFQTVKGRINDDLDDLWNDLNGNAVIDATDGGLFAQMVARETAADSAALDLSSNVTTVAKGVLWNAALAATSDREHFLQGTVFGRSWSNHPSSGNGVHNPFLLEALLNESKKALMSAYSLSAPAGMDLSVEAIRPPGVRGIQR